MILLLIRILYYGSTRKEILELFISYTLGVCLLLPLDIDHGQAFFSAVVYSSYELKLSK